MQILKDINSFFILQSFEHLSLRTPEMFFDEEQADKCFKLKVVEKILNFHSEELKEVGFEIKGKDTDVNSIISFISTDKETMKEYGVYLEVNSKNRLISAHFPEDNTYYRMSVCFQSLECKQYL